ncbi:sulfite exporter TauE/SafE family protein [Thermophagus sp. OGC60D27]|uniref:sulfite exporter TauE/SafE family protein n=1 Tax=Thermophagus sp. OGC60D27 TaxID=3458415 RepID=UPI004037D0BA
MIFYSAFEWSFLWLPLIGFIIGFGASVTGGGGGFFILPVLILMFHVPGPIAVTTSLAATIPVCLAGSWSHYRQKNIDLQIALVFILTGIAGSLVGAWLTNLVSSSLFQAIFGFYCLILALQMLYIRHRQKRNTQKSETKSFFQGKRAQSAVYGFLAGIVTGMFGTSGTAPVLAGLLALQLPLKIVAGTSLLVVTTNTFSALGAHLLVGRIDMTLILFLTGGTLLGALLGPRRLARVKTDRFEDKVRFWYALALALFGIGIVITAI